LTKFIHYFHKIDVSLTKTRQILILDIASLNCARTNAIMKLLPVQTPHFEDEYVIWL